MTTNFTHLIESELEKAEVVLDTKAIVAKLQKMIEDLASVEAEELIPMMDKLKSAYGEILAGDFKTTLSDKIRLAIDSLSATKDAITSQVEKLEGVIDGDSPVDPVDALAGAEDPDAVIAASFRESLRRGVAPVEAAKKLAEAYRMEYVDIVAIIKESRKVVETAMPDNKDSAPQNKMGKASRDALDKVGRAVKPVEFGGEKKANVAESMPDNKDSAPQDKMGKAARADHDKVGKAVKPVEFGGEKKGNVSEGLTKARAKEILDNTPMGGSPRKHMTAAEISFVNGLVKNATKDYSFRDAIAAISRGKSIEVSESYQNDDADETDMQAASKLADRMKTKPGQTADSIKADVTKMAGSVGKTAKDADKIAPLVQAKLDGMGKVKESAKRK